MEAGGGGQLGEVAAGAEYGEAAREDVGVLAVLGWHETDPAGQGAGQGARGGAGGCADAGGVLALAPELGEEFAEEEGVAAGGLVEHPDDVGIGVAVEHGGEQVAHAVPAQVVEADGGHAGHGDEVFGLGGVAVVHECGDGDAEDGVLAQAALDVLEEPEGGFVRPVEVVDEYEHGLALRQVDEHPVEAAQQVVLAVDGDPAPDTAVGVFEEGGRHGGGSRQEDGALLRCRGGEQVLEKLSHQSVGESGLGLVAPGVQDAEAFDGRQRSDCP